MKKIFIAVSILAVLCFSVAPSQALLGMPDDVPGNDVLLPFFVVSMPGFGNTNTLLVITDFRCGLAGAAPTVNFHYTVYTKRSATVYDDNLKGTKCDIISTDALSIINLMSPIDKAKLEYDLDGDGTKDSWVGYIYFSNLGTANSVGAQILLADLAAGMVSSVNAPVKEYDAFPANAVLTNNTGLEVFSANALKYGKNILMGDAYVAPTNFGLYPRYYINSSSGQCYLFLWKTFNNSATRLPANGTYHVFWYDNAEHKVSASFDWPDELTIMDVADYIPASLWAASTFPKEGFVAFEVPDINGVGFYGAEEWLGYTWLKDVGAASESWSVLNPMWRDAW